MGSWNRFGPADAAEQFRVTQSQWPIASYQDRDGYVPGFIGADMTLPLPQAQAWQDDLVTVVPEARVANRPDHEIAYRHFTVVMCRSRGLPLFSAVNIDGSQTDRSIGRDASWRRDSRIPANVQNLNEGYGREEDGFFSRGHMTRRQDPNWGSQQVAEQANADTFHITNVAPQQQDFNEGMWLRLEDYVLGAADRENLRITVVTGPILREDDPVYYNRMVPVEFWKVIAFVHSQTGELTTIGYRRSQVASLPRLARARFVFGDFEDCQVSIAGLAEETGLDLSAYAELDVMARADPRMEIRLRAASDLRLRR